MQSAKERAGSEPGHGRRRGQQQAGRGLPISCWEGRCDRWVEAPVTAPAAPRCSSRDRQMDGAAASPGPPKALVCHQDVTIAPTAGPCHSPAGSPGKWERRGRRPVQPGSLGGKTREEAAWGRQHLTPAPGAAPDLLPHLCQGAHLVRAPPLAAERCSGAGAAGPALGWVPPWGTWSWQCLGAEEMLLELSEGGSPPPGPTKTYHQAPLGASAPSGSETVGSSPAPARVWPWAVWL